MFKRLCLGRCVKQLGDFVYEWTVIRKCDHFCLCVCVGVFFSFVFYILIILFFKWWIICNGKPLFLAMVQIVSHACCLACSVIGVNSILLCRSCTPRVCVLMEVGCRVYSSVCLCGFSVNP